LSEPYEIETEVRLRRPPWALLALVPAIVLGVWIAKTVGIWLLFLPVPFAWLFSRRVVHAHVRASKEGLRIGERLVPRAALGTPLVRHDDAHTYVAFRGRQNIDVAVPNNIEADALMRALAMDAGSTAADIPLILAPTTAFKVTAIAAMLAVFLSWRALHSSLVWVVLGALSLALFIGGGLRRVTLRVGADGLALRPLVGRDRFIGHEDITDVHAEGATVVIVTNGGERVALEARGAHSETRRDGARDDEAAAVVRRIAQARTEHREGANAPALSAALDAGGRTAREWLAELKRLGEGAAATFRTIGVAREQLFDVALSTTAPLRDRIAALVALRGTLKKDEETRVRVAAARIAAPDVRDRMVRVLDASDDEALENELHAITTDQRAP
jgi:hypothetical protein